MKRVLFFIIIATTIIVLNACSPKFTNPSPNIQASDLVGVWSAEYAHGVNDTLVIKSDGTFKQLFEDSRENYVFDSGWREWTLEYTPDGLAHLHLQQARYYLEGITIGESNGRKNPENPCLGNDCSWGLEPRIFYDPFLDETMQMVDELLLVPLIDANGKLILHHVWTSSDRGFVIIGGNKEIFHRKSNISP